MYKGDKRYADQFGRIYTDEESEFIAAMDEWMRDNNNKFPAFTDILAVAKSLGYKKVRAEAKEPKSKDSPL